MHFLPVGVDSHYYTNFGFLHDALTFTGSYHCQRWETT